MTQLLVIDDDEVLARSIASFLERRGFSCHRAFDATSGLTLFDREKPALTIVDYKLGRDHGLDVLRQIRDRNPEAQVVIMTGHGDIAVAVEAMKCGARDFLTKPAPLATIATMAAELVGDQSRINVKPRGVQRILGRSGAAIELRQSIKKHAAAAGLGKPPSVLISGEPGLLKAKVASALREESPRGKAVFVHYDCATPSSGNAAELSAHGMWEPLLEEAQGGTLLLKEISALGKAEQAGLVSAFRRGLADRVWMLATSNTPLGPLVQSGHFSPDLLYHIQVGWIDVPPLRERGEDVLPIVDFLARKIAHKQRRPKNRFTPKARAKLLSHSWPGNIRELQNCLKRAILDVGDARIDAKNIHFITDAAGRNWAKSDLDLQRIERSALQSALEHTKGNVSKAADLLGITRDTLRYRMSKFGLLRKQR